MPKFVKPEMKEGTKKELLEKNDPFVALAMHLGILTANQFLEGEHTPEVDLSELPEGSKAREMFEKYAAKRRAQKAPPADEWLDDPKKYGLLIASNDGTLLEDRASITETLKNETIYIFHQDDERKLPYMVKMETNPKTNQPELVVTEDVVEVEDLLRNEDTLKKIENDPDIGSNLKSSTVDEFLVPPVPPEKKLTLSTKDLEKRMLELANLSNQINGATGTSQAEDKIDQLNINREREKLYGKEITDEQRHLASQSAQNHKDIINKSGYMQGFFSNFKDETSRTESIKEQKERSNEPEPKEFTTPAPRYYSRFWNAIVSIFDKRGSAAKRLHDKEAQDRQKEYTEIKARKTQKNAEYNANCKRIREYNKKLKESKELIKSPEFQEHLTWEKDMRAYQQKRAQYSLERSAALAVNPTVAALDIGQNGLTPENIEAYSRMLGAEMKGRVYNAENPMEKDEQLAELMLVSTVAYATRRAQKHNADPERWTSERELENFSKGGMSRDEKEKIDVERSLRYAEKILAQLNDPDKKKALIESTMKDPVFLLGLKAALKQEEQEKLPETYELNDPQKLSLEYAEYMEKPLWGGYTRKGMTMASTTEQRKLFEGSNVSTLQQAKDDLINQLGKEAVSPKTAFVLGKLAVLAEIPTVSKNPKQGTPDIRDFPEFDVDFADKANHLHRRIVQTALSNDAIKEFCRENNGKQLTGEEIYKGYQELSAKLENAKKPFEAGKTKDAVKNGPETGGMMVH